MCADLVAGGNVNAFLQNARLAAVTAALLRWGEEGC